MLLTVLWSLALAATLALSARLGGADAITASHNRVATERGRWEAAGCVNVAVAALDAAFDAEPDEHRRDRLWASLDRSFSASEDRSRCDVHIEPVGHRLDLNGATGAQILAVLTAAGVGGQASVLSESILDWRDADETPRPSGAERSWYANAGRPSPRNGDFLAREELSLVRGFDDHRWLLDLFDVESGPILATRASPAVLAAVPGFSADVRHHLATASASGDVRSLQDLLPFLPPDARSDLLSDFDGAARAVTFLPGAWSVSASVAVGAPPVVTHVRARLQRTSRRLHIAEVRSW